MCEETGNIIFIGGSHILLRLYDFKVVAHTVQEAVMRLVQRVLRNWLFFSATFTALSAACRSVKALRTS